MTVVFFDGLLDKIHNLTAGRSISPPDPVQVQPALPTNLHLRNEVLSLVLRLVAAGAFSYFTFRILSKYLDPQYDERKSSKLTAEKVLNRLGISNKIKLTDHELVIATNFVSGRFDGVNWEDIGGCEEVVADINQRVILPIRLAAARSSNSSELLAPPKGVLLYGPPGCGKTLMARAVAKAANAQFINLQVSALTDKWYGESQKLAAAVFSLAYKLQPVIIFIDEIDSFLRKRQSNDHEATAMMKAQFMSLWDGFVTDPKCVIIIMGATNRPEDVDKAILRRMPARFHVGPPDVHQRASILSVILKNESLAADFDLNKVAQVTDRMVGSDLKELCRLAAVQRAQELITMGVLLDGAEAEARPLTEADLLKAAKQLADGMNTRNRMFDMKDTALD